MSMKISPVNNGLYSLRYSVTHSYNANAVASANPLEMATAYKALIEFHDKKLNAGLPAKSQVFKNHLSTLQSFLLFCGKTTDSYIGKEFKDGFEARVHEYLCTMAKSKKAMSDKRGHLRLLRHSYQLLTGAAQEEANSAGFAELLRNAMAASSASIPELAKQIGVHPSTIRGWLGGAAPGTRLTSTIRRLEALLGLTRGALGVQVSKPLETPSPENPRPNAFRERMKARDKVSYFLRDDEFPPTLACSWKEFLEYKTATYTSYERRRNAKWRLLPLDEINGKVSKHAQIDGMGCLSAVVALEKLRAYWGFLVLGRENGGLGLRADEALSMGALAVPEWLQAFMQFMKRRSGGATHAGHAVFAGLIASMTNPDFGYLPQRDDFFSHLSTSTLRGRSWPKLCHESLRLARAWKADATDISRDPAAPLQPLLELDEPLVPMFKVIQEMDKAAAKSIPGSEKQALLKRDALLLNLLLHNPLRIRTVSIITCEGAFPNLYKRGDEWRLRFKGDNFKNDAGAKIDDYDASVASLGNRIDEYLDEFRPVLVAGKPENGRLFPSTGKNSGRHADLGKVVSRVTKRYLPETGGFGPHAIRHLVPSAYLKSHPKDFLTVAELLHDELATVMSRYAHLSKDDSMKRYSDHVDAIMRNASR